MLSVCDQDRIAQEFSVYEHEWRFFSGFLGEPFLLNNCLVYWDGTTANVCAFPLGESQESIGASEIDRMLSALP